MATETEIVNAALDLLFEEPILAGEDDRAPARWMKRNLPLTRDALLRRHPWNFALRRVKLPRLAADPAFGWGAAYQLPSDCLRVLPLADLGQRNGYQPGYAVEGRRILTDASSPLFVQYVARVEDVSQFDALFVEALSALLASKAAVWITGKQSYAERARQLAENAILQAQMVDALEGTPEDAIDDAWDLGRQRGIV